MSLRPARTRIAVRLGAALLASALAACSGDVRAADEIVVEGEVWFEEVAAQRGLAFEHRSGHAERYFFPEIMGGGAALIDLDDDGDLDAYLVQSGSIEAARAERPGNVLFANDGTGSFENVTAGSGADDQGYGMGVAAGDADGDGGADLYVTNVDRNTLLLNRGELRFEDATEGAGCGGDKWSVSAAFLDHDLDGDLDLFVTNYLYWSVADELDCDVPPAGPDYCSPQAYRAPAPDTLWRNDGTGRFEDVSADAGLRAAFGNGLGVVCGDFDADGYPDVFVANDGVPNQLWQNGGDGTFTDGALLAGVATDEDGRAKAGMGVAAADLDEDGDEELLVVNLATESDSFYRNDGPYFSDRTASLGLAGASRGFTRFGCGLHDFDLDGRLDLFVANGRVSRGPVDGDVDPYAEPNLLLRGGEQRFEPIVDPTLALAIATSRAAAFGDVDGDGRVDVLVNNRDAPAHLFRTVRPSEGAWIGLDVRVEGRTAHGATLEARTGASTVFRTVRGAFSYGAANDPRIHLGLGTAAGLDLVRVRWPDGVLEDFEELAAGRVHRLARGAGRRFERR